MGENACCMSWLKAAQLEHVPTVIYCDIFCTPQPGPEGSVERVEHDS